MAITICGKCERDYIERVAEVLTKEAEQPLLTWWLSFADGDLPKGQQFLGLVIVDNCPGLVHARLQMTLHGVASPGGEIQAFGFNPKEGPADQVIALALLPRLTLLSRQDVEAAGISI